MIALLGAADNEWSSIGAPHLVEAVRFLILAMFGQVTMWMAVFADVGASLLVVANGLRMLRPQKARSGD